jgi:hypothetical protein
MAVSIADIGLPIARIYLATALFSVLLLYLIHRPRLLDVPIIAVLGAAFTELHLWAWTGAIAFSWPLAGAGLGMATFLVLLLRVVWTSDATTRQRLLDVLVPSALLTVLLFCTHNLLSVTGVLHPRTLDLYALSFDGSLGFEPSFWVARHFESARWFGILGNQSYFAILLAMAVAHLLYARWRPHAISRYFLLQLFFLAGLAGYLIYQLFPAAGPAYAFPGIFPHASLTYAQMKHLIVEPIPLPPNIVRNAMPSLHMSWALAVWWNLRTFRRTVAWAALTFALLTVIGTLGTGEHYLIDLVVSFPFTMLCQALLSRHLSWRDRTRPFVAGILMTSFWIVMLRFGLRAFWISPVVPWAAIAITVGTSLLLVWPITRLSPVNVTRKPDSKRAATA